MIESIGTIEHVLADVMKQNQSLLIIGELDPKVLNTLNLNKIRNGLKVCAIKPPNFGWKKDDLMEDIARATGANCFTEEAGDAYQMVRWDDLGTAEKVVVNHENTIVVLSQEQQSSVANVVEELWENMDTAKNKDFIKERIATISGKIGVIYVGANSDIEQKEKRDREDDAVCATRAALEEGILPGGGVALKEISDDLAKRGEGESQRVASLVLCEALKSPFYQILTNAGLDSKQIEKCLDPGIGYDVKNDVYGNMYKLGIIDPTKVTKSAVLNAISVASTFLSTNVIITNVREK